MLRFRPEGRAHIEGIYVAAVAFSGGRWEIIDAGKRQPLVSLRVLTRPMAKGGKTSTAKRAVGGRGRMRAAQGSPELEDRLDQARVLRDPRVRALWPRLEPRQQQIVLDPSRAVGHRYPLTSGEVAEVTRMSERQVRYWADRGLIPHWRKGRKRLFEAVGLIAAFSITNASQHELQFYRGVMEEPFEKLAAKFGILASLLASRLEEVEPNEAKALTGPLGELTRH